MSLWRGELPAFFDPSAQWGMSDLMRQFMAGIIEYAPEYTVFLAPYINSYKRFMKGTFAPTKAVWSVDNRTAGFRLCGDGTRAVRVECRIGGSDLNPYLAQAALLAAGIKGIENGMALAPPASGDVYQDGAARQIPATLREATGTLRNSAMLREAMGDAVINHYVRCAEWEQEEFDRVVTDWEIARGFERA
jgi:glutamine synthetase